MKNTIYILTIALLLISCKKLRSKAPLTVDITCQNPVDGSAFPGVIFKIYEVKDKFSIGLSTNQKKELIYTGTTDVNGKAYYEFDAIKNSKFSYEIFFDYSNMDVPEGEYYLNKTRDFDYLKKNEDNVFDFDILPYGESYTHIKNVSCFDSNDKMRYRLKYLYTGSGNWTGWQSPYAEDYFYDCYDNQFSVNKNPTDKIIYEMQITKNNITTTILDTFYRAPNTLTVFELFY